MTRRTSSRPVLLTIVTVTVLAATAPQALATTSPPSSADLVPGASPSPDAVLEEGGRLVMGGDAVIDCPSVTRAVELYADGPPDDPGLRAELQQARQAAKACEQAGFRSPGAAQSDPTSSGASASASATVAGGEGELPSTSGPTLPVLLAVAGVLLSTLTAVSVFLAWRFTG